VEVAGRKLVGSAQVRVRGTSGDVLLQHGSILIEDDQGLLAELGIQGDVSPRSRGAAPAALVPLLGRNPGEGELEGALLGAFGACAVAAAPASPLERELELKYRSDEWTWRS
jgi:lipoate-protein ligase A